MPELASAAPPKVELRNVDLRYFGLTGEIEAIKDISLAIAPGEFGRIERSVGFLEQLSRVGGFGSKGRHTETGGNRIQRPLGQLNSLAHAFRHQQRTHSIRVGENDRELFTPIASRHIGQPRRLFQQFRHPF